MEPHTETLAPSHGSDGLLTSVPETPTSPSVWMSTNDTLSNITNTRDDHVAEMDRNVFQSVDSVLLGVSVVAVVVVILLLLMVVLRYLAHQKGSYYTREETSALKSDSEVQQVQNMDEDPEEDES